MAVLDIPLPHGGGRDGAYAHGGDDGVHDDDGRDGDHDDGHDDDDGHLLHALEY